MNERLRNNFSNEYPQVTTCYQYPSVITIAGSDSGGGAGIQADLKTFAALGCYGTSAITAVTVQNTMGVSAIHPIPAAIVSAQIKAVLDDIPPSAIKIGMVHSAEHAAAIAATLYTYPDIPIIFDPVMVATSGDQLIKADTLAILKTTIFPMAALLTPNLEEARLLVGRQVNSVETMRKAAEEILGTGCQAVLVKGGHLDGDTIYDVYVDRTGRVEYFESDYIDSQNVHGTGCTLSSAIAAYLAIGEELLVAVAKAREYVFNTILEGRHVRTGHGHGPLNHFFNPQKLKQQQLISPY
jgi:hydroxymethylpyrimidine/phosphomethylpyrimidine kinase